MNFFTLENSECATNVAFQFIIYINNNNEISKRKKS